MRHLETKVEMKRRIVLGALDGHGSLVRLYAHALCNYAEWRMRSDRDPPTTRWTRHMSVCGCVMKSTWPILESIDFRYDPSAAAALLAIWTAIEPELQIQVLDRLERGTRWMQQHVESLRAAR